MNVSTVLPCWPSSGCGPEVTSQPEGMSTETIGNLEFFSSGRTSSKGARSGGWNEKPGCQCCQESTRTKDCIENNVVRVKAAGEGRKGCDRWDGKILALLQQPIVDVFASWLDGMSDRSMFSTCEPLESTA
jgi:hypothetical protein